MTPEEFEKSIENVDLIPEIERQMKLCCANIQSDIRRIMDETTRSDKPYWSSRSKKYTYPSLPGHPPAPDTGDLKDIVNFEVFRLDNGSVVGRIGSIQTDLPYGAWHELGRARGGKPRPWLAPAVEDNEDFLKEHLGEAVKTTLTVNLGKGK